MDWIVLDLRSAVVDATSDGRGLFCFLVNDVLILFPLLDMNLVKFDN